MLLDLFCSVIDNFGDAGVCWRLARQLAAEEGFTVRLWIDRLEPLSHILPGVDPGREVQCHLDVEIRHWHGQVSLQEPGDVVVEAFGCPLPQSVLEAMARRANPPVWINLEYLSGESWVEGCHGLPSRHPRLSLEKFYFFPGFTPATGGPLRESDLLARQADFVADPSHAIAFLHGLEVARSDPEELVVSLFCYQDPVLETLLEVWSGSSRPVLCLIPQPVVPFLPAVANIHGACPGTRQRYGALTLQVVPFLGQEDYDRLLWSCDLNFVRGEDSFLRAQWAQRPFVWQAYRQAEDAHHDKVTAFLELYLAEAPSSVAGILRQAFHGWNGMLKAPIDWQALLTTADAISSHNRHWAGHLARFPGLAAKLAQFVRSRVK